MLLVYRFSQRFNHFRTSFSSLSPVSKDKEPKETNNKMAVSGKSEGDA